MTLWQKVKFFNAMKYSHYIITQFNLRNFPLSNRNDFESWLKWTRNRIKLFREYCLPSVMNQSSKSFTWLLFFDIDTPEEFNGFLKELDAFPGINICFCRGIEDFEQNYLGEVKKRIEKSVRWIITSRIDNDDCLNVDAIRTIQENFTERHKFLISLASGYVLNINDRTLSHYFYPMSPFISLIESCESNIEGVFSKVHTKWESLRLFVFKELWLEWFNKKARKSRFIMKKPLWIQTFHGDNISNSFYRGFPVLRQKDLSGFSLDFPSNSLSVRTIGKYYDYVTWKRYFKCLIIKFLLNK